MLAINQSETRSLQFLCLIGFFMAVAADASNTYTSSYTLCEQTANDTMIELTIDEKLERMQIEQGAGAVCDNLAQCSAIADDLDYMKCIREIGNKNLDILVEIHFNATSAHTRLRTDYDEVHQTFLLCTLEAQQVYVNSVRLAYNELLECRAQMENCSNSIF
ncbi:uncharacterized protein LOC115633998 isoform X2 [Scaptodrosophila lebanonensis]|uniref:Uncharacterized protein LOC115633998 isoform X2 n=1 Tax=Drosophila lebanonensis TaxID=7225 RepID=A0A6J2UJK2_DROLE|nr:uncharacterized protein LOC115633998 isoform X2 [Scaptodrosophila lebanonensis]